MSNGGFSLVEVLVTLGIVAILVTISAAPNTNVRNRQNFKNNIVQFRELLQNARNTSRTQQACVTLSVTGSATVTTNSYSMVGACVAPFINLLSTSDFSFDSSVTVTIPEASNPVIFNQYGGLQTTEIVVITLTSYGNSQKFNIYPVLGQIVDQ